VILKAISILGGLKEDMSFLLVLLMELCDFSLFISCLDLYVIVSVSVMFSFYATKLLLLLLLLFLFFGAMRARMKFA